MKSLTRILTAVKVLAVSAAVFLAAAVSTPEVQAQGSYELFRVSTPIMIPGSFTTNVPITLSSTFRAGSLSHGFFLRMGATNAASTTNCTVTFEQSDDGVNWADNAFPVLSVPQTGTTGYDWRSNILVGTSATIGGAAFWRIKTIQNTNLASIWITNACVTVR